MASYLDKDGLIYVWSKIKSLVATKVDKVDGKGLSTNDFTTDYKTKLDGIEAGAQKNDGISAISYYKSNGTTMSVITPDKTSRHVTFRSGEGISLDSSTAPNLFGSLIISTNCDTALSSTSTAPVQNKVVKTELDKKAGTAVATTTVNGLMSKDDKTKLDGIATGANKTTVDAALSSSSTNPVQNKVINDALNGKAGGLKITGDDTSNPGTNVSFSAPKDSSGNLLLQTGTGLSIQNLAGNVGVRFNVECGEWVDGSALPASVMDAKNAVDTLATTISNTYAKKTDLASVYMYKGSKATKADLPTTGNIVGDVWNVEADDMNYAWDGNRWDPLGGSFDVVAITNAEIDAITAA